MTMYRIIMGAFRPIVRPGPGRLLAACLLGLALSASVHGRPALAGDAPAADAGDACRIEPRTDIVADPDLPAPLFLYCGTRTYPSGFVAANALPLSLPEGEAERRAAIERVAAIQPAGRGAALRMDCRAGTWMRTEDGVEVLLKPCTLNDGRWPLIAVVAPLGKLLVQGEALPDTLPALRESMARMAGYAPPGGLTALGGIEAAGNNLAAAMKGDLRQAAGGAVFDAFNALLERARLESSRGAFPAAEDAFRDALALQERTFGPDSLGAAMVVLDLALAVSNQGRLEEAAALLRRADPIVQKSPNKADQARFFTYLAFNAANGGRFADAYRYAQSAGAIWRGLVQSDTTSLEELAGVAASRSAIKAELAHALNLEAAMAWRIGDMAMAELAAREAMAIASEERGLPLWWRAEILTTLGDIHARQGRYTEAETSFRGALVYQNRVFGETLPTATTLMALGRVYAEQGLAGDSVRAYEAALRILQEQKGGKASVMFDQIAPLFGAVAAEAARQPDRRGRLDDLVFGAVQRVSFGVADQTIAQAGARIASDDPKIAALVERLQDAERRRDRARIELAYQTSLPDEQRGSLKEDRLLADINGNNDRRAQALDELSRVFPDYLKLVEPPLLSVSDLQKRLAANEAMVLFVSGRDRVGAVLIRPRSFSARLLASGRAEIDAAVSGLRRVFAPRAGGIGDFDPAEAHALYRSLFGAIEGELAGVDHLIVAANGTLASLPPALLVDRPPEGRDPGRASWLIRRFAVSQVPSVAAFAALRDRARGPAAAKPFLGIGDPLFAGRDRTPQAALKALGECRGGGPVPASLLRALAPLPETGAELAAVAQSLGAGPEAVHLGADATESRLRAETLADYRVIYFATHGLLPGELACRIEPALALSPPEHAASKAEDGLLEASEIAQLRLKADLVVLSACNTAEGGGEALSGLSEAFFHAGARTVIASHWQVPSRATATLMAGLFDGRGDGPAAGAALALRRAQLALIETAATAHPYFWAAFTVIGDGGVSVARGAVN